MNARQLRVLHLINRPQMRGAEMFAVRLAQRLEQGNVSNAICSLYPPFPGENQFDTGDLESCHFGATTTVLDRVFRVEPKVVRELRRILNQLQPDVVVGHGTDTLKYASIARRLRRKLRTVYLNIGIASHWAGSGSRVWFNRFWLRKIDRVISVSEYTLNDFLEHYGFDASRALCIPNAVRIDQFDAAATPSIRYRVRSGFGISDDEVAICMVGSLSTGKGHDDLIDVTSQLTSEGLPVKLVFVGDGPERDALSSLAKSRSLQDKVIFAGIRSDVPEILHAMDVFAMASRSEGMPAVLVEAGVSGLSAVAYDVGGVTEVIDDGKTGSVVPLGDIDLFTVRLRELVADGQLRGRMGSRAADLCRARFNLNTIADQYEQVFRQLCEGVMTTDKRSETASAE